MFLGETGSDFPATLKNLRGELLAEGRAGISPRERSVTFTSDFVPLYPVGTPMTVFRLHENSPVHRFDGCVYLSDKKLMRLVSVEDELLPGAEEVYCNGMHFPAKLTPIRGPVSFFRRLFPKAIPTYAVQIVALTHKQVEFQLATQTLLEEGAALYLEMDALLSLPAVKIKIQKAMLFGTRASYLCSFVELTPEAASYLHHFMITYTAEHGRLP